MIQEKRRLVCDEGLIIMEAEYDKSDKESIVEHAKETKDKKISELIDVAIDINSKVKGAVGNMIQA